MKKPHVIAGVALAALVSVVLGCAGDADSEDDSADGTEDATEDGVGRTVDRPGEVAMAPGEQVVLELAANPTTGYDWTVRTEPDLRVARIVSNTTGEPDSDAPGAGSTQRVVVEALGEGSTTIDLALVRPWEEGEEPAESARFDLVVD